MPDDARDREPRRRRPADHDRWGRWAARDAQHEPAATTSPVVR